MIQVILSKKARKSLDVIPDLEAKRIDQHLQALEQNPFPHGAIKLANAGNFHRLRVGKYRIIYEFLENRKLILVATIGHRKEVYKK